MIIMKTKKELQTMKLDTVRIERNKAFANDHHAKKNVNEIVKEVNNLCDSNIS